MSRTRPCLARVVLLLILALCPALVQAASLTLTWGHAGTPSLPVTEFRLYRSFNPDPATFTGEPVKIAATLRAYTETNLAENQQYCWYLTAHAGTVQSPPSNVFCDSYTPPPPPETPPAPTGLRGTWKPKP